MFKTIFIKISFVLGCIDDEEEHVPPKKKLKFALKIKALNSVMKSIEKLFKHVETMEEELENIFATYEKKLYPQTITRENFRFYSTSNVH